MKKFIKQPIHANTIPLLQRRIFTPQDFARMLRQITQLHGCSIGVNELPGGNGVDFMIDDECYTAIMNVFPG